MNDKNENFRIQLVSHFKGMKDILQTEDQDYVNAFMVKAIEESFNKNLINKEDVKTLAEILNKTCEYNRSPRFEAEKKNRDWNYALDFLINQKIDYCAVCGNKLHNQHLYPKEYPDKWKLCCTHHTHFKNYIDGGKLEVNKNFKKKYDELFTLNLEDLNV